jgi:hypothetical protein
MSEPSSDRWGLDAWLEEERRLRTLAEAEVRGYRRLLEQIALHLAPHRVDAQRRQNPHFPAYLTPSEWLTFFTALPPLTLPARNGWKPRPDPTDLARRLDQVEAERDALRQRLAEIESAPPMPTTTVLPDSAPSISPLPPSSGLPAACRPLPADSFVLSPAPPTRYAARFQQWEREGLVLALLALTGWSLRHAIDEAVAERVGIGVGSGSTKRLFRRLETQKLVASQVYRVGEVQAAILTLTPDGEAVVRAMGLTPVPSEWSILMARHGGPAQSPHAALCCVFAYQARRRSYGVTFCPSVSGPAQPDLALTHGDEVCYVEAEAESGEVERRLVKWRNQADLQGYVALCAPSESVRQRLVAEAKLASPRGKATDVASLIRGDEGDLWVEKWGN